jgi:hypothetical protein
VEGGFIGPSGYKAVTNGACLCRWERQASVTGGVGPLHRVDKGIHHHRVSLDMRTRAGFDPLLCSLGALCESTWALEDGVSPFGVWR